MRISAIPNLAEATSRMNEPRVHERAESIRRVGLIQRLVIDEDTNELIAGRDRLAALMVLGYDELPDRWIEWRRDGLKREVVLAENLERRQDDRDRHIAEYTALLAQGLSAGVEIVEDDESPDERQVTQSITGQVARKPGRPRSAKGAAREKVAAAIGASTEAVRRAEQRAATKAAPPKPPEPKPARIKTLGLTVDPAVMKEAAEAAEAVAAVSDAIKRARAALREVPETVSSFRRLKENLQAAAHEAAKAVPASVCPHCKLVEWMRRECSACSGTGWVDTGALEYADRLLLAEGKEAGVFQGGRFVTLSKLEQGDDEELAF